MRQFTLTTRQMSQDQIYKLIRQLIQDYEKGKIKSQNDNTFEFSTGSNWTNTVSLKEAKKEFVQGTITVVPTEQGFILDSLTIARSRKHKLTIKFQRASFLRFYYVVSALLFSPFMLFALFATSKTSVLLITAGICFGLLPIILIMIGFRFTYEAESMFIEFFNGAIYYADYISRWRKPMRSLNLNLLP
ncbi:MAG: hypothetical protein IH840_01920 [Candidatus Heimdallarchaeota archaeon]|nr:hypothetical protein [Candidatus Heimdallarchaeota archaeon]